MLAFANTTVCEMEAFAPSGGRPSYLSASLASLSKLGVWGRRWKCAGLSAVCGVASWGTPSIQTCCGVAPRARGWLSHRTMSSQECQWWKVVHGAQSAYRHRILTMQSFFSMRSSTGRVVLTFLKESDTVIEPEDRCGRGSHGRQREVVREAVVIRLLRFGKEETGIQYGMIRLRAANSRSVASYLTGG